MLEELRRASDDDLTVKDLAQLAMARKHLIQLRRDMQREDRERLRVAADEWTRSTDFEDFARCIEDALADHPELCERVAEAISRRRAR